MDYIKIEWGLNEDLKNTLLSSKNKYRLDKIENELSPIECIEYLIYSAKNYIDFYQKRKIEYIKKGKKIKELETFKKLLDKHFTNADLLSSFLGEYAKSKNSNSAIANIKKEVFKQSIINSADGKIKQLNYAKERGDKERNETKNQCLLEVKEILKKENIRDFNIQANDLIDYNF